jgi:hypothetical protein
VSNFEVNHKIIYTLLEPGIPGPSARYTSDRHLAALFMDACSAYEKLWTDPHYDIENDWREWQHYKKMKFPNTIPSIAWKQMGVW